MRDALTRVNKSEENLRASNESLQELNQNLEVRVSARTNDLELANQRNEKRARQFEAIAQVARAITANQKLETLLPSLAELISNRFGFYHAGIFLIDEDREFAELRATNSDGGKRMLARGHKLAIGQSGIVGFVSATGKPRIALDVEADAAFFNNPDLPNTHSEMALPLRAADQIIGVLDVQSIASNAFQEEDIDVLSTLADQVSSAIQNARSFERSQELLTEAQRTSGEFLRESWRVLQSQEESLGYQVIENKLKPLHKPIASSQIKKAMATVPQEIGDHHQRTWTGHHEGGYWSGGAAVDRGVTRACADDSVHQVCSIARESPGPHGGAPGRHSGGPSSTASSRSRARRG